jgi:hypothetical protein
MNETPSSQINEDCRNAAINEVVRERPGIQHNTEAFIRAVGKRFIEKQVERFPELCEIARVQNLIEWENQRKYGKKGKYSDSYGWSEDGTFKFDYKIPQELYLFMVNLVHYDFWEESNERVWRKFMKKICDGEDCYDALMGAKNYFGVHFRPLETMEM